MTHPDVDLLLELVLAGDRDLDSETAVHVADCADCADELATLRRITTAGRTAPRVPAQQPGGAVWQAVADELTLHDRDVSTTTTSQAPVEPADLTRRRGVRSRRRVMGLAIAASVLVGLALGAGVTAAVLSEDSDPSPTVVATAPLAAISGTVAADDGLNGSADVVQSGRVLAVTIPGLRETSGDHYEVWLADESLGRLVPLGVLRGGEGTFTLPPDVDLDDYRVVDVSRERTDGDPGHSGNSLLRGGFRA